jgi:hypothetical protein
MSEVKKGLRELKDVAAGESGVPAAVWRSFLADEKLCTLLLRIMRECWNSGVVPEQWTVMHMNVLSKSGPGMDFSLLKNYRGIAIAEVMAKLYAGILKERLEAFYETIAPDICCGFRRGRSRNDSVFVVKEVLRKRKEWGQETFLVLWDVVKMFDRIPKEHIWTSMRLLGVDARMIQAVQSTLKGTKCVLEVDGINTEVNMVEGSGQGTKLGPMLCNLFMLPILEQWMEHMQHVTPTMQKGGGGGSSTPSSPILPTTRPC